MGRLPQPLADWIGRLNANAFPLLPIAVGVAAMLLILVRTSTYGPHLSSDSLQYIAFARNLASGEGYVSLSGGRLLTAIWPPLFPSLLAAINLLGPDPLHSVTFVNATAFGITVFITSWWLNRHVHSRLLKAGGVVGLVLSPHLNLVFSYAWSEALFILFTMLSLFTLQSFLKDGKGSTLVVGAAFVALACLTRWIGGAVILTGVLLLLANRNSARRDKLFDIGLYTLIAALPAALWVVRNAVVTGLPVGRREPSETSAPEYIQQALDQLGAFILLTREFGQRMADLIERLTPNGSRWHVAGNAAGLFCWCAICRSRRNIRVRNMDRFWERTGLGTGDGRWRGL